MSLLSLFGKNAAAAKVEVKKIENRDLMQASAWSLPSPPPC